MARLVLKFGGTSVADLNYIKHAANLIYQEHKKGHEIIVVVSAMAGETNKLLDYCQAVGDVQDAREVDVILSSGEQITSALMSMAIQNLGLKARSFLGWQIPLKTSNLHMNATIDHIETKVIETYLSSGGIAIIPGFQGVSEHGRITTLGRGGSDLTAVALAAAFKAARCDIYTDVTGVYFCDPKITKNSTKKKLDVITYDEIIEMSKYGAQVMQHESVSYAKKHHITVQVLSAFGKEIGSDLKGTFIQNKNDTSPQLSAFVINEQIIGFTARIKQKKCPLISDFIKTHKKDIKLIFSEKNQNHYDYKFFISMALKSKFKSFFQDNKIDFSTITSLIECVFIGSQLFQNKTKLKKIKLLLSQSHLDEKTILYSKSKISVIIPNDKKATLIDTVCSNLMG